MFKQYQRLLQIAEQMVYDGANNLDPVVRSIQRKAVKIYWKLTDEERTMADWVEWEY